MKSHEDPYVTNLLGLPIGTHKNPSDAVLVQLFASYFSHFMLYMIVLITFVFF